MKLKVKFKENVLARNAALCKSCGDYIESRHVHDFVMCSCKSIGVDGGHQYAKRTGIDVYFESLSVWTKDVDVARHLFAWGSVKGVNTKAKLTWMPISQMSTTHIEAVLKNCEVDANYKIVFNYELELRKNQK